MPTFPCSPRLFEHPNPLGVSRGYPPMPLNHLWNSPGPLQTQRVQVLQADTSQNQRKTEGSTRLLFIPLISQAHNQQYSLSPLVFTSEASSLPLQQPGHHPRSLPAGKCIWGNSAGQAAPRAPCPRLARGSFPAGSSCRHRSCSTGAPLPSSSSSPTSSA